MLQLNTTLKSLIEKLWNRFWSGGISNPISAIEQITYLLFMKQLDKLDRDQKASGKHSSRFSGDFFLPHDTEKQNPIDKSTLRWSYFKEMDAELLLPHIQQKVFPFIKDINGDGSAFTHHMTNAVFLIPSANLLQGAIVIIEEIFLEIERDAFEKGQLFQDIQGDVYEMLLNEISSAGRNGQFRTPRHIIKLVSELVNPQLGQSICDPACGTAGFLLDAYQYIVTKLALKKTTSNTDFKRDDDGFIRSNNTGLLTEKNRKILEQSLNGYDFDTTMVRLALMNLMMHGIDNPHIDYRDTLSKSFKEKGEYDIIMANPPFTGSIDKGDINESLRLNTTKTELLFIERIFTLLKAGGTAGVIIPQGVLFGSSGAFVEARKKLVEEAELKAVISLPSGVFKPYAGVATAILVFTRGSQTDHTWFYQIENDGLSLDDKRQRCEGSELPDVVAQWNSRDPHKPNNRAAKHFFVPVQELRDKQYDLSFNRYHEAKQDETFYEEPLAIIDKLKTLEDKIQQGLIELEGILQ
ncbi:type I restriction enzyme M protein [Pseudomonas koreensis]|uniref:class I SAM-dependent DNA methyltransferase n=1 Tax=Pseudomonas koreensis TaxID=198620 RepID=UPI00286081CB|nr:N-6 DNA methylase [Pseudomonas koreensis]MDR7053871.1 type I restriction enzyme M protein [Pseudomonas koreensis]